MPTLYLVAVARSFWGWLAIVATLATCFYHVVTQSLKGGLAVLSCTQAMLPADLD